MEIVVVLVALFGVPQPLNPFEITSEGPIQIGNSSTSQLWALVNPGDVGTLSADYPKGYNAFYVMKYEITQGQYRDFLNKLTRDQQDNKVLITGQNNFYNNSAAPVNRNGIRLAADPGAPLPRVFDCDLNNNGIGNENDDGEHIVCNYLSWYDVLSYLAWSGLRPMTELEYEKACRGPLQPFPNEKAWGNSKIMPATGIINAGLPNEVPSNPIVTNVNFGSAPGVQGPLRAGSFAGAATTREQAGATYYGIMEMSGNCVEFVADMFRANPRNYTGEHGNGVLLSTGAAASIGNHTQTNWPNRGGLRGGRWSSTDENHLNVSDRAYINADYSNQRYSYLTGRGVRTAP